MNNSFNIIITILVLIIICSCENKQEPQEQPDNPKVKETTYIERTSKIGNTIVCPDNWDVIDSGQNWTLSDGQGAINVYTVTAEGSGTLTDFRDLVVVGIDEII